MPQVTLNLSNPLQALDGYKTYSVLGLGAAAIVLNHFGFLPEGMLNNNPANWTSDLFSLLLGATFRSALNK